MLEQIPSSGDLGKLIGDNRLFVWISLCNLIGEHYDMDKIWNKGGKEWTYEYKYRRGGKTLCALYARENCIGFMVILGKAEREKFEVDRANYSIVVQNIYDEATTYHDGKWIMFEVEDTSLFDDFVRILAIKRRPNRKK